MDNSQMIVFKRMAFPDSSYKQEFLTIISMKRIARSEDVLLVLLRKRSFFSGKLCPLLPTGLQHGR